MLGGATSCFLHLPCLLFAKESWNGAQLDICLVFLHWKVQVKVHNFYIVAGKQMSCSEFVSPDALLDLGFCYPQLDTLRLGAPHGRPIQASSVDRKKEEGKLFILLKLAEFFYFLCFQLSLQAAWALPFLPFWLSFILFLPFWLSFPFSGGISYSPFFKLLSLLAIL